MTHKYITTHFPGKDQRFLCRRHYNIYSPWTRIISEVTCRRCIEFYYKDAVDKKLKEREGNEVKMS